MLFDVIRSSLCPFDKIENLIPNKGKILDVGCGHGIFCRLLIAKSSNRSVLGIDPSAHKIKITQKKATGLENLKFKKAYLKDIRGIKFDCITIIDVLYLFSPTEKVEILSRVKNLLKPDGFLILVEVSSKPDFLYKLIKLEETLMVQLLKYTYSDTRKLYFQPDNHFFKLLKKIGFKSIKSKRIQGLSPYPKHLLIQAFK